MFIETEAMPSPAELKFLPGQQVFSGGTLTLRDRAQAARSPIAARLFEIPGISAVVLGRDFITITKERGEWQHLKPAILGAIVEHFTSGAPIVTGAGSAEDQPDGHPLADRVREALHRVIDPELGYDIVDLGLVYDVAAEEGGIVRITMTTTTPGCPATNYLKEGSREAAWTVDGVEYVEVDLTYEPRWTPQMMSDEAKARFGICDGDDW